MFGHPNFKHYAFSEVPANRDLYLIDVKDMPEFERMSSPYPVVRPTAGRARVVPAAVVTVRASGSVTVPGRARAASTARIRYAWGSTPLSFAVSQSV